MKFIEVTGAKDKAKIMINIDCIQAIGEDEAGERSIVMFSHSNGEMGRGHMCFGCKESYAQLKILMRNPTEF